MTKDERPTAPLRPGARFEAEIVDLTSEGAGVARVGGLVVFVPGGVPGDRVAGRVRRLRRGFAEGDLLDLVAPSAARRPAPCPHQSECGGCPLMVLDENAALAAKVGHLEQVLRRIGGLDVAGVRAVASPRALGYRGRVRFAVAPRPEGPLFGFRPRGLGDALVPVGTCLLAPPRASEIARLVLERLDAATPGAGRPWPEQLELRGSHATGEWLVVLHTPAGPWPEAGPAAARLVAEATDVAGVVRVAAGRREFLLAGRDAVVERIAGVAVELGATTFLQVNPAAAERLYQEIGAALGSPGRLLDLYCGVGLNGLVATASPAEVVGIELHPGTVERARRAAERAHRPGLAFHAGDAVAAAAEFAGRGERFDAVALNPPRQGAGPGLAESVRSLAPHVVVVVSCHPAALARDLARFAAAGFALDRIAAVDLFPQTPHLEAVARLVPRAVA